MIFYEDRTECDCGEILYQNGINYLTVCEDDKLRCNKCMRIYTYEQVEF